jgi:polyhydroxybutyrate depolymerase
MKSAARLLLAACALLLVACSGPSGDASSTSSISPSSTINGTIDSKDASPSTYDPYAGTLAAVDPSGRSSEGSITTPDGRVRTYRLYVPTSASSGDRLPLLLALHGGLGWGAQFEANSGFDGLAEANRFIVVYPDGTNNRPGDTKLLTWNGGLCCRPAAEQEVDDVGFLRALIDRLEAEQPVDQNRVFVTGHSNGAILGYRLACELSDQVLAIGVQSGVIGVPCHPSQPVSVFHLHGLADSNIPIDGGRGSGPSAVEFPSPREAASGFAALDGCQVGPTEQSDSSNADVLSRRWSQCADGSTVQFVTVTGASHAWMGHPTSAQNLVGPPYMALDASRAIWSFLAGVLPR